MFERHVTVRENGLKFLSLRGGVGGELFARLFNI